MPLNSVLTLLAYLPLSIFSPNDFLGSLKSGKYIFIMDSFLVIVLFILLFLMERIRQFTKGPLPS
jgi:hypothetical protein